jgi:hypothetical protein
MKRIGKIATENRSQAKIDQLADSVPSAQHADIRVYAHHYHISGLNRLQEIPHLLTIVADRVR